MMIVEILSILLARAPFLPLGSFPAANRDKNACKPAPSGPLATIESKKEIVARILSTADWDFIANQPTDALRLMFGRERRAILRLWLSEMRRQMDQLMSLHGQAARPEPGMNLAFEFKLLKNYGLFRVAHAVGARAASWSSDARRFGEPARRLAEIAERLEYLLETRLAGIEMTQFRQIQAERKQSATITNGAGRDANGMSRIRNLEVEEAIEVIKKRELLGLRSEFSGLTYLASTRDYNSGRYYHEGLARRFSEEAMESALAFCHKEIFERLACSPLEELARQLEIYMSVIPEAPINILRAWSKLEPFRVLMPMSSDHLSAELFVSNVRMALAILR
ncbi:MAG: hypothetical protein ACREAM_23870 [Blastocatellia bacterium]